MKKLVLGLLATVLFLNFTSAQDTEIISGKINSKEYTVDLPSELRSDLEYKSESQEFIIYKHYYTELKGYITIITDSNDRVVAIALPTTTSEARFRNIVKCIKNAFWGNGSGWGGYWDCVVND